MLTLAVAGLSYFVFQQQERQMQFTITSVDYAPEEFDAAVPIAVKLLRQLPGPDRSDYWLGELLTPFDILIEGRPHVVRYLVLAARWQDTQISPNVEHLPVNIAVVLDEAQLNEPVIDFAKSHFIAIGVAKEVESGKEPPQLANIEAH